MSVSPFFYILFCPLLLEVLGFYRIMVKGSGFLEKLEGYDLLIAGGFTMAGLILVSDRVEVCDE